MVDWNSDILAVLRRAGLLGIGEPPPMEPLTGGVSSDIWRVELGGRSYCVKRALAKLKVKADWRAPIERSRFEAAWMREAARIVPEAVPALIHADETANALVMEHLEPATHRLWKEELRQGVAEPDVAAEVGRRLVAIHAGTARDEAIAARFRTDRIFHAIRLEPYLLATAKVHSELARPLRRIARETGVTRLALVHGDVSPKNILIGSRGPIFLDAECAWFGDPAFDLAFCLNHLLLKCLWTPEARPRFLACFEALLDAYMAGVVWESRLTFEGRAARLLPGLFLARIDGKSPVEYVTARADKERVRRVARRFIAEPPEAVMAIRRAWEEELAT